MTSVFLVRHPRPDIATGVCYGKLDLPLADPALHTVEALRCSLPQGAVVWSSPLRRCLELARAIHREPSVHPDLREIDFGDWEGRGWDSIDRGLLDAWADDIEGFVPPGGESVASLRQRVTTAVQQILANTAGEVIMVTHGGVMRVLLADALGLRGAACLRIQIGYGQVVRAEWVAGRLKLLPSMIKELGL